MISYNTVLNNSIQSVQSPAKNSTSDNQLPSYNQYIINNSN
jgi:hypothetical protein